MHIAIKVFIYIDLYTLRTLIPSIRPPFWIGLQRTTGFKRGPITIRTLSPVSAADGLPQGPDRLQARGSINSRFDAHAMARQSTSAGASPEQAEGASVRHSSTESEQRL